MFSKVVSVILMALTFEKLYLALYWRVWVASPQNVLQSIFIQGSGSPLPVYLFSQQMTFCVSCVHLNPCDAPDFHRCRRPFLN